MSRLRSALNPFRHFRDPGEGEYSRLTRAANKTLEPAIYDLEATTENYAEVLHVYEPVVQSSEERHLSNEFTADGSHRYRIVARDIDRSMCVSNSGVSSTDSTKFMHSEYIAEYVHTAAPAIGSKVRVIYYKPGLGIEGIRGIYLGPMNEKDVSVPDNAKQNLSAKAAFGSSTPPVSQDILNVYPSVEGSYSTPFWRAPSIEDEQYLAKVIVKEAGDIGPSMEWAGIAWAAVNRANARKRSIKNVVAVLSWPGGGPRGRAFVENIKSNALTRHARYPEALQIAASLLRGEIPNPIGSRTHFVHKRQGGFKKCNSPTGTKIGKKFICENGIRVPIWSVSKTLGGVAKIEPLDIGRATFMRA